MPSTSLPTGTVSHRRGDRTRPTDTDADPPRQPSAGGASLVARDGGPQSRRSPPGPQSSRDDVDEMADRIAELEAEVEFLERELDRREADHQEIIHRYEHVLAESTTTPEQQPGDDHPLRTRLDTLVERLDRFRSDRLDVGLRPTDSRRQADGRPLRERLLHLLPWR